MPRPVVPLAPVAVLPAVEVLPAVVLPLPALDVRPAAVAAVLPALVGPAVEVRPAVVVRPAADAAGRAPGGAAALRTGGAAPPPPGGRGGGGRTELLLAALPPIGRVLAAGDVPISVKKSLEEGVVIFFCYCDNGFFSCLLVFVSNNDVESVEGALEGIPMRLYCCVV